jgi:ribosomal protein S12 methylthiotransferase accessory factor
MMTSKIAPLMQTVDPEQDAIIGTIALIGDSSLTYVLKDALADYQQITVQYWETLEQFEQHVPLAGHDPALVVGLSAHCHPIFDRRMQRWCKERGLAYLRIGIWHHEAVIGPFVLADQPGCVACSEVRRVRALTTEADHELAFLAWCEDETRLCKRVSNPWLTWEARQIIGLTVARDIKAFLHYNVPAMGWRTVRFLRLRGLTNQLHMFVPDPQCEICAPVVNDCAELAEIQLQPHPRTNLESYRVRSLLGDLAALEHRFVDHRLGLYVRSLKKTAATFASMVVHYFEYPYIKQDIVTNGVNFAFQTSRATAILEALERNCGFLPRSKRSVVYGSYEQLHTRAVNPEQFGLLTEPIAAEREADPSSPWTTYSSSLPFHWVWGYSFQHQQPVLVPEQIAYYGTHTQHPDMKLFVPETSNGCALGGSLEDAIFHGLCEVIERDAFFLTWYGRLPVPGIDWQSTRNTDLLLAAERVTRMTGFTFRAFDCTTDIGVPAILVIAVNAEERMPRVLLGAGAHLDPEKALEAAFLEAAAVIPQNLNPSQAQRARGKRLVEDSSLIQTIDDHLLAGSMPEAFARFSFLLADRPQQTMQERFAMHYTRQPSSDLTKELTYLIGQVSRRGHDVIVVDQTASELRAANFWCVRVLAPGLIPLTFGQRLRRTRHLHRLYRIPQELGYADHILTEAELNPDPHAFL